MTLTRRSMLLGSGAFLAACAATPSKFLTYTGPEVTGIVAYKETRVMHLLHNERAIASYNFQLGFAPDGQKRQEGDGRTPEGQYFIDRRNPNSRYHLSIGVSYPNATDQARARAAGVPPGGDIFIHGTPRNFMGVRDWTVGCLAVTDPEIEAIYSMVRDGTPVWIVANPDSVLAAVTEQPQIIGETMADPDSADGPAITALADEIAPGEAVVVVDPLSGTSFQVPARRRPQARPVR